MPLDLSRFSALTFDCIGTLIDWPTGILAVLRPIGDRYHLGLSDADLLARYADIERQIESGPYLPYREVLARVMQRLIPGAPAYEAHALASALPTWQPFPDTLPALQRLAARYRLAVLSNVDDDLFAPILDTLGRPFETAITASQVRSYKPAEAHFREAMARLGLPADRILHVAESRFHDVEPAARLGMGTVWVHRGATASGPSQAQSDLTVRSLAELAQAAGL